jgi:hypothetical protein
MSPTSYQLLYSAAFRMVLVAGVEPARPFRVGGF